MNADGNNDITSVGRMFHYFAIIGSKSDDGLQLLENPTPSDQERTLVPPLQRGYKAQILGYYPNAVPTAPFDQDAVLMLSLPKGLQFRTQKHALDPAFHPFVVTRENGSLYYGFTFTFYEEVNCKELCTLLYTLQSQYLTDMSCAETKVTPDAPENPRSTHSLPRQLRLCAPDAADARNFYDITKDQLYITKCISLVGPHPFLMAAGCFLTDLYKTFIDCKSDSMTLESYVYNLLFEVPAPPNGRCLSFMCVQREMFCIKPSIHDLPLCEYSLQEFFSLLSVETVLQLLTCVLLENQIVLVSSDYYRLMLIAECICVLIFPFTWQNVYVPILPSSLGHFLDAPVPFIMGLQRLPDQVEDICISSEANLCLLDVDQGIIEVPEDISQIPYKHEFQEELLKLLSQWDLPLSNSYDSNQNNHMADLMGRRWCRPNWSFNSNSGISIRRDGLISPQYYDAPGFSHPLSDLYNLRGSPVNRASSVPKAKGNKINPSRPRLFETSNEKFGRSHNKKDRRFVYPTKKEDANWISEELRFNNAVREIFLNWFAQVFFTYEHFVILPNLQDEDYEQWLAARETAHNFDKATFLVDQPDAHLPFLSRFIESQLFTSFIDQKIISGDKYLSVKVFDIRIKLLRSRHDDSILRTCSYEECSIIPETEQILLKRIANIDFRAPPPQAIDPQAESCTLFNPSHFPLLDKSVFNREPSKLKRRGVKAWQRRERHAQHLEQITSSPDQREKVLQEARNLAHTHPNLSDMSPAFIANTNWKFVDQLIKECKTRTKRMLVQKMGSEAVELGHGEGSLVGVEENMLIASLCELLERIWGHGLQRKLGKSALWSNLLSYQETLTEKPNLEIPLSNNFLSPAMAWCILRKRIDQLSSKVLEMESAPSSPTHPYGGAKNRSRSVDRESGTDKPSFIDWKSPRFSDPAATSLQSIPTSIIFDMKNVLAMPEIKTHIGYSRAWVRLSLEKKLLSQHLKQLLSNSDLLRTLYKRYAFLRCEDEKEQFLSYLLSLNAVDYFCFTSKYTTAIFPFRVIIFTSRKISAATTSANVWVSIGGTLCHTPAISIPRSQNEMIFQHKNLGLLTTLRIGHDNSGISPKWMVEHVLVRNEVTGHTWKFPCGRWLGRGIDDGSLERILVGELVPSHISSEDLVETCRTPPRCRSPNVAVPKRNDGKLKVADIQQLLGDAVNSIVKYFHKPDKERGNLTLLLCGDLGLVHCMELVFSYGFKSTRIFGKNLYIWDYYERVKLQFEANLREEMERLKLTGISSADEKNQIFSVMNEFDVLISRINSSSSQLGKDDKFQLFVCLAARDHLLHRLLLPFHRCLVTSQMYDESAFVRDPSLIRDLIKVLSSLSTYQFFLEATLTRDIEN